MMGAHSNALKTRFNGFESDHLAVVSDAGWYRRDAPPPPARLAEAHAWAA